MSEAPRSEQQFPGFNGLRALAATLVFTFHGYTLFKLDIARPGESLEGELSRLVAGFPWHAGEIGVALFYVISAFLLYRPFVRRRIDGDAAPGLGGYTLRRAMRIIPAYWLALLIMGLISGVDRTFTRSGLVDYWLFGGIYRDKPWLHYHPYIPSWTIAVEVSFYVFLPIWAWLVARLVARRVHPLRIEAAALIVLVVVAAAWKITAAGGLDPKLWAFPSRWFVVLPANLDLFAAGMAIAVVSALPAVPRQLALVRRAGNHPTACWVAALLLAIVYVELADLHGPFHADYAARTLFVSWAKVPIACLILLPAVFGDQSRGAIRKALASGPVFWIGMVSYGFFIWHVWVIRNLTDPEVVGKSIDLTHPSLLLAPLILAGAYAISLGLGAASWYSVEQRCLAFAHRRGSNRA